MLPTIGRNRRTAVAKWMRELEQFMREQEKMVEKAKARREVDLFTSQIELLRTIHWEAEEPVDWVALSQSTPPYDRSTQAVGPREAAAQQALAEFSPSFWDRLFGRTERKLKELEQQVADAKVEDALAYAEWERMSTLAQRIISGEQEAWLEAIDLMKPFADLEQLGSDFTCSLSQDPLAHDSSSLALNVEFRVRSARILPQEVKKLTKTGKLSVSQMPITQYYELEQDYVCSCMLRIARELFNLLPLDHVYVHATEPRLNTAIGKVELATLVSARIERSVFESLNLQAIDPSDAMSNFTHRMKFLKTRGFQPIDRVGA